MEQNDATGKRAGSPKAERILAIDDEIASLERVSPNVGRYAVSLISLFLMLGAVLVVSGPVRLDIWLFLIRLLLIMVGIPAFIYGALMWTNRRQRLRLEREMDELIADHRGAGHPARLTGGSGSSPATPGR